MIRKIFIAFSILMFSVQADAQLNNSWIDYNKTYYKFFLANDTLCRISQSVLASAGLGNIPAEQFQLWRNGQQVRLYTSATAGPLGAGGYIEFLGFANDGKPDRPLYADQNNHMSDAYSMYTDTAAYYLTVNPAGGNLRYVNAPNNPPGAMVPDAFFMRSVNVPFKTKINQGYAAVIGEYVFSSEYDEGEGWASHDIAPCCPLTYQVNNMNVYTAGPPNSVSLEFGCSGNALNDRNVRIRFFNNQVLNQPMPYFNMLKTTVNNIPLSFLQSPNFLPVSFVNTSSNSLDRMVTSFFTLTYPAKFDFNNEKEFRFNLGPSASGNYLVIDSFNFGTAAPILYDLTNGNRYIGDIASAPGKVNFVLPPSALATRSFILVNQESGFIQPITALTSKTFINYSQAANQGDYLIISHPSLFNNGSGVNNVDLYRQYRASAAGGGYNAKIADINELDEQFGFGIKKHPSAIRDFIRFSNLQPIKPKFVLLLGRGTNYKEYFENHIGSNVDVSDKLNLVQTFGIPASDVLLTALPGEIEPKVPIGRIAAVNGNEVGYYLDKLKQYDLAQQNPNQTITDKAWMKNIMHIAGGADSIENSEFVQYLNSYKTVAEDTSFGAHVETFSKTSVAAVEQANSQRIEELMREGVSYISYFGHSSANVLQFNLSSPDQYQNQGKYPFFNVNGCTAGNIFTFNPNRLTGDLTISEKYVLTPNRGSIAFMASTHFGIPPMLHNYSSSFYNQFGKALYGGAVGSQLVNVIKSINAPGIDYFNKIHLEEITLHGDPAIKLYSHTKPDYVVEDQTVRLTPNIITVADNSFKIDIRMLNIGRAIRDSIRITVKQKLPNDSIRVLYDNKISAILYSDSLSLIAPINPITDKGANQLTVTLDANNKVDELSELNNIVVKNFFIFTDELRPAFPYNYSIVNQQGFTYYASTANPVSGTRQYVMELDTTELFNSSFKKTYTNSGVGGLVEFKPANITYTDSTVYYWRVSIVPTGNNIQIWNTFSFVYITNSSPGFNQSHYYQHQKSTYQNITLASDRLFKFNTVPRTLTIRTGLYPYIDYDKINVNLDFDQIDFFGCRYNSLQFYVYDSLSLSAWENFNVSPTSGRFGSWPVCDFPKRKFFEFPYYDQNYRKKAMDFIDSIPTGMYVSITNLGWTVNTSFINQWKADTAVFGSGNSLYHKLKGIGFAKIDSFYRNLPFIYFYKKGTPSYTPIQVFGIDSTVQLQLPISLPTRYDEGKITSPKFGPAKKWNALHWRGTSIDPGAGDTVKVKVYGVQNNGTTALLATVMPALDTSLAFINAAVYPYVYLEQENADHKYFTPNQLRYWMLNADYVPEGAVAPNILFTMKDTVEQGEKINFSLVFKNISPVAFDSLLKVKLVITDRNNVPRPVNIPKRKTLPSGDTLRVDYTIDSKDFSGSNILAIDFNPDDDQPEQYHFNNVLFKEFFVKGDQYNPLLDVTFDGVHILNQDIVSSKPNILIKLKDESRFLALADTALIKVQVRFPDKTIRTYFFGPDMTFTPANLSSGQNTATIDFHPNFPLDGEYELIVSGKDVVGNKAGTLDYSVVFKVINKPMISNLLNYPNPFTTSTAFVFTVTGNEVPQNIRIQILTITGKVVREITKNELGPIHIGRNITEFKWDGTDMYGQKLANGVYLYRVLTNLNGKSLDKYRGTDDDTDKYFNKGYGKMYLMR